NTGNPLFLSGELVRKTGNPLFLSGELVRKTGNVLFDTGKYLRSTGKHLRSTGNVVGNTGKSLARFRLHSRCSNHHPKVRAARNSTGAFDLKTQVFAYGKVLRIESLDIT